MSGVNDQQCVIEVPICVGTVNWTEGTVSCILGGAPKPATDMSVDTVLTVREDEGEDVPKLEPELELDVFDPEFDIREPEAGRGLEKRNGGGWPGMKDGLEKEGNSKGDSPEANLIYTSLMRARSLA